MNDDYVKITLSIIGIAFGILGLAWLCNACTSTYKTEDVRVTSKSWKIVIQECEDYTAIQCDSRSKQSCSGTGSNRVCTTVFYTDCYPVTRTRVLNQWERSGFYPDQYRVPEHSIQRGYKKSFDGLLLICQAK